MSDTPNQWTLEGFVDHFDFFHHKMHDHKFVWVLGAGASRASGIPLGSELVDRWLQELHLREDDEGTPLEDWATAERLGIVGFEYENRVSFYPMVYQRRFRDYPDEGFAYLEGVMSGKDPSPGYSILAAALAEDPPRHNAVITTNFDNLVADALSIYTDTFPFVCGHESLTTFVRVAMRRPLICKIHRDLMLAPHNDPRSLKRLHDAWGLALRALFEHYTPLFLGYGGNDDTLMDLLESLQPGDIKGQILWCFHESRRPSDRIVNLVIDHKGILIPVPDFDLLMVLLGEKMGISLLDEELDEEIGRRARERTQRYRQRIQRLDTVNYPVVTQALAATLERSGGWWAWEQKTRLETDPARREIVYRQGIQQYPQSAELHNNFAAFMWQTRGDYEQVEQLYRKALQLDPQNADYVHNLASFVWTVRGDFEEAQRLFRRALQLDPSNATIAMNCAKFLTNVIGDHDDAERLFRLALKLEPNNGADMCVFASFLWNIRGVRDEAERLFRRALELDPDNAGVIGSFAIYMWNAWGNYDEAEQLYRRALALDPTNGEHTCEFASFLWNVRGNYDEAERLYREAVELDSDNAIYAGNLASFLTNVRGNHEEAEELYCRALELNSENPNNHGNYAAFLLAQGRLDDAYGRLQQAKALNIGQTNQLAAELELYEAILACVRSEDEVPAIEELRTLLLEGFSRGVWNFSNVLAYARANLPSRACDTYSLLATAILDPETGVDVESVIEQRLITLAASSDGNGEVPTRSAKQSGASGKRAAKDGVAVKKRRAAVRKRRSKKQGK